uniref:Uncharacterized protein n=1 Tax=Arundo donax TaxID=35708 RepID=A0A0A8Z9G0_ARUDO
MAREEEEEKEAKGAPAAGKPKIAAMRWRDLLRLGKQQASWASPAATYDATGHGGRILRSPTSIPGGVTSRGCVGGADWPHRSEPSSMWTLIRPPSRGWEPPWLVSDILGDDYIDVNGKEGIVDKIQEKQIQRPRPSNTATSTTTTATWRSTTMRRSTVATALGPSIYSFSLLHVLYGCDLRAAGFCLSAGKDTSPVMTVLVVLAITMSVGPMLRRGVTWLRVFAAGDVGA